MELVMSNVDNIGERLSFDAIIMTYIIKKYKYLILFPVCIWK